MISNLLSIKEKCSVCSGQSSILGISLFHNLLVVFTGFPPEWDGTEVAEADETCDEWAVKLGVAEGTHAVGNVAEDNW